MCGCAARKGVKEAPALTPLERVLREQYRKASCGGDTQSICDLLSACQAYPLPEAEREFLHYMLLMLREHAQCYSERVMGLPSRSIRIGRCYRYLPRAPYKRDYYLLLYLAAGKSNQQINGLTIPMRAGDFCLLSPGALHGMDTASDECELYQIVFRRAILESSNWFTENDRSPMAGYFRSNIYGPDASGYLLFHAGVDSPAQEGVRKMLREAENQTYSHLFMHAYLLETIGCLFRDAPEEIQGLYVTPKYDGVILDMLQYMQNHAASVTMADLEARFHFSRVHITRILKRATGYNFMQWMTYTRISQAARTLARTGLPVAQIAEISGYENVNAFIRTFKKVFHKTPAAYRQSEQENIGRGGGVKAPYSHAGRRCNAWPAFCVWGQGRSEIFPRRNGIWVDFVHFAW